MPPRSHTAAARTTRAPRAHETARPRPRPRPVAQRLPISKVGWDRKFRIVMVVIVAMVGWIGLKAGLALLAARAQSAQETSLVLSLERQHRELLAQERALHQPATIIRDARQLGMVQTGERPYVVVSAGR